MKLLHCLLFIAIICSTLSPCFSIGLGAMAAKAILMQTKENGVHQTDAPEKGFNVKKPEYSKPMYKDYYSKTSVNVDHVVSTTLYQQVEYVTVLNETWHSIPIDRVPFVNHTTAVLQPSPVMTQSAAIKYDEFEWPTETQVYTTALNHTTTTVVENGLFFL